jgi:hypothetical protein
MIYNAYYDKTIKESIKGKDRMNNRQQKICVQLIIHHPFSQGSRQRAINLVVAGSSQRAINLVAAGSRQRATNLEAAGSRQRATNLVAAGSNCCRPHKKKSPKKIKTTGYWPQLQAILKKLYEEQNIYC